MPASGSKGTGMSFIVRSVRKSGTVTYHCASTRVALAKLQDFQRSEYRDITITTSDERVISEDRLRALAARAAMAS